MKKTFSLLAFGLMVLQLKSQPKTVKIHGVVKDTSVKSIEVSHLVDVQHGEWRNIKLNTENGKFDTSIQIPFPAPITISCGDRNYINNYIDSDAEILIDSVGKPHVFGSSLQSEYENEFLPFFKSNNQDYDSLRILYAKIYEKYGTDIPKKVKDSAILLQNEYYFGRAALLEKYIKLHPNSFVALWDICFFVSLTPTHRYFDFEKLFSSFSPQMQKQSFLNVLKEKIKFAEYITVGQIFPIDFFKGNEQMLSKVRENNQYYLVDFWYSHCGLCVAGFPKLKEVYAQFHKKGFDIISISIDKQEDEKEYVSAIKKYGLTWNHVWDKDGLISKKYNVNVFPTYVLVDKNGKIINPNIRVNELAAFLKGKL